MSTVPSADGADASRMRLIVSLLAAALIFAFLFLRASAMLGDPDSWWHIRVGLDIIATGSVPTSDTYSHSFNGQPWIAKEWLSQVLLALAYRAGGWNGVVLSAAASISLAAFLLAWQFGKVLKPTLALALALGVTLLSGSVFTARPHLFTLPIIVVWTASLFRAAQAGRPPPFQLLVLLWLWANLHASFTLGFVIAAFAGLAILVRDRLSRPRLLVQWGLFGASCVLVSLVNPYGIKAILATFTVAGANEAVPMIGEWRPFNAARTPGNEAALLLMLLGLLIAGLRIGLAKALFVLFALHLYLVHERFVYVFFLLVPLILAPQIAEQHPCLSIGAWASQRRDGAGASPAALPRGDGGRDRHHRHRWRAACRSCARSGPGDLGQGRHRLRQAERPVGAGAQFLQSRRDADIPRHQDVHRRPDRPALSRRLCERG